MAPSQDNKWITIHEAVEIVSRNNGRPINPDLVRAYLRKHKLSEQGHGPRGRRNRYDRTAAEQLTIRKHDFPTKEKNMHYNLTTNQADRISLDAFAYRCGYEDAKEIVGNINIQDHANELVDQSLENEELTDDPEEYRARFVDAYVKAFEETREQLEREAKEDH